MANINKIKLSGTTYNIQDENAPKTVELTQAQYDALAVKDPNTFYIITDAEAVDLANYYTKSETDDLLDTKLDVSAYTPTDLSNYYDKTEVDGLLDSKQDSSKLPTYVVSDWTYNKSTHKVSVAKTNKTTGGASNSTHTVITINNQHILDNSDVSNLNLVETSAITTSVSSASTDSQVPSAKAVYDQFGGLKLVKLTQQEYDALTSKDSNTLYIVTDS